LTYNISVPAAKDPLDDDVHRMVHGDDESFRVVFRAVQPRLQRYLVVMVGQVDAEDVASETWAQACRDLSTFSGGADAFRAWITVIGRHRALDHLRAASRRPVVDEPLENLTESVAADDVEDVVQERDSTQRALQLIATLPREQAEAVLLRAVMGLDAKASGAVLGRSAGAVRTAAYRGLKALKEKIAERE
jgi:RNA polymerase sigma-70 factor (ECF subfamily)